MENTIQKINLMLDKISIFMNLDGNKKKELTESLNVGFMGAVFNDSKDLISKETIEKMRVVSNKTGITNEERELVVDSFFKEVSGLPQGPEILQKNIDLLLETVILPIQNKLSEEQKEEIKAIFA